MSRDSLEKVLYDLSTSGANKKMFAADPMKFLGRYQITDEERDLITSHDVRALADRGVNTMLTWGFWLQSGRRNGDYMKLMQRKATLAEIEAKEAERAAEAEKADAGKAQPEKGAAA